MKLLRITVNARNRSEPLGVYSMKAAVVFLLTVGLAFSSFATDVPSVNELTETLSRGPWAELPVRVAALVRHAKTHDRNDMTIAAVKAAVGLNPAAATAVVGSIARAVPAMTAIAAEAAAAEQPKQAPEIAKAAAAADHAAAAAIVAGVSKAVPDQCESVAIAVSEAVPGSGKEILQAVAIARTGIEGFLIDQVVAQYNAYLPSVGTVPQPKPNRSPPMTHQVSLWPTECYIVSMETWRPNTPRFLPAPQERPRPTTGSRSGCRQI